MKKYISVIVFVLNTAYLVIIIMNIIATIEKQILIVIYSLMLSVMFFLFWQYTLIKSKKNKKGSTVWSGECTRSGDLGQKTSGKCIE